MKAQVLCRTKTGLTESFDLPEGAADLGRDKEAAVPLPLEGVSRRHARISWDGKHHWLEDLKSTNGTFLNGLAVQRDRLRHLDVITLGRKVDLVYLQRGEEHVSRQPGITRAFLMPLAGDVTPVEIPVGEVTLGRAQACNVVVDLPAVSKFHARIVRAAAQLEITDLGSANGSFVNGARVTTTVLRGGDIVSLGGACEFKVRFEVGVVATAAGGAGAEAPSPTQGGRRFSAEWKTRFDWSTDELLEIGRMQKELREQDAEKQKRAAAAAATPAKGAKPVKAPAKPPAKPAAAPAAPTAKPEAAAPKEAAPETPPKASAAPVPAAKPAPPAAKAAPAPAVAKPAPAVPAPKPTPAPAAAPQPPAAKAVEAAALATANMRAPVLKPDRIAEVRLTGSGFDVAATATGDHVLGRLSTAALLVNHTTVSRQHARITIAADRKSALIADLGGANGTFLNGVELKAPAPLAEGDMVRIGTVTLKVTLRLE